MITPRFNLKQDETSIYIEIRCPYVKASVIQFEIVGDLFVFSIPPYYLRLRLPGRLIEDEHTSCHYDISTSLVHCKLTKETKGEVFPDLDMLTKLLAREKNLDMGSLPRKPLIEEVSSSQISLDDENSSDSEIVFDEIEQKPFDPTEFAQVAKYGFNGGYKEILKVSQELGNDVLELPDSESSALTERKIATRSSRELFDVEYYWADLFDNPAIDALIAWKQPGYELTPDDTDLLLKLTPRKYILTQPKQTYLGLLQLLFGQAFEWRCNEGESTVESAWTVGKICPMMSTLDDQFTSVTEVMIECTVRALVFPLYRHYDVSIASWKDVLSTLESGRSAILQRLLKLLAWFTVEQYHVFSRIWLEDYAVWIQSASDRVISGLAVELTKALQTFDKEMLGLQLLQYEEAAHQAIAETALAKERR